MQPVPHSVNFILLKIYLSNSFHNKQKSNQKAYAVVSNFAECLTSEDYIFKKAENEVKEQKEK